MIRLLCIVSSMDTGGAETFLMKLYRGLDKSRYQMDFIAATSKKGYYDDEIRSMGGKIYHIALHTKHPVRAFWQVKHIVKSGQYNCVLKLLGSPIGVIDLLAARTGGARLLAARSCGGFIRSDSKKHLLQELLRKILNKTATVKLAPSDLAARYTFGDKLFEAGKVTLLHNALDLSVYRFSKAGREEVRKEFSLGDSLVIGHIGRFTAQKNHAFLLEVFAELKAKRPDAKLLLVGTGPLQETIRQKSEKLGLDGHVIFAGVRSDIPALLSAMDAFVFPSFYEGMPNTVIEAQATGLPCVIADTITKGAKVTDLVNRLSLGAPPAVWANAALSAAQTERTDTSAVLRNAGYDIEDVIRQFIDLCFV